VKSIVVISTAKEFRRLSPLLPSPEKYFSDRTVFRAAGELWDMRLVTPTRLIRLVGVRVNLVLVHRHLYEIESSPTLDEIATLTGIQASFGAEVAVCENAEEMARFLSEYLFRVPT
jgi:hypothetical protein